MKITVCSILSAFAIVLSSIAFCVRSAATERPDGAESCATQRSFAGKASFSEGRLGTLRYLLYTPKNASPGAPLIVYLHGSRGRGEDLSILTRTESFPKYLADGTLGEVSAYVLIPQISVSEREWKPREEEVVKLVETVCREKGIDRRRVSLAGFSMGGTGTWSVGASRPDVFSRIAPMSGGVSTTRETLAALRDTPIWAFVGEEDVVVRPRSSERFVAAVSRINAEAKITVFPETEHEGVPERAWNEKSAELLRWLIE